MSEPRLIDATALAADPLEAAASFHNTIVTLTRAALGDNVDVVITFAVADHRHKGWRLAAVQELARTAAPCRVNAIAGMPDVATLQFLANAPGVTGQVLQLDGNSLASD